MLVKAANLPAVDQQVYQAKDVDPHSWFAPAMLTLQEKGILAGYPDGTLRPNQPLTGVEAASLTARTLGLFKGFFEALREKEEEVARFLFTYFYRHVFKATYFITQDVQLAEDVVQETFFKALGKLRQLDDETKINTWLSKIAINTARSLMRKNRRFPVSPDAEVVYRQASEYLPEEVLVQKEDLLAIWQTVDNLPAESQPSRRTLSCGMQAFASVHPARKLPRRSALF